MGFFYAANMGLQTFLLYPFFHVYNYELCRKPTTPKGVPYVTTPHFMSCFSLMLTTAALDNYCWFTLKGASQPYRESDFLMAGNSVSRWQKLKSQIQNGLSTLGIVVVATAVAYPAEIKWRRYLSSVDYASKDAKVLELWRKQFKGSIWTGFWASCFRNGFGALLLNLHYFKL